jgi:hypothetical protein
MEDVLELATEDRTAVWLPLLAALTASVPEWLVLKHPDSAFTGSGDIDTAAARDAWPAITEIFREWAAAQRLGPVVVCPHAPTWLHLVALDPHGGRFFELDVNERKLFLGSTLYRPSDLLALTTMDPRGFRRLRPGAEGLIKLVHNGMRRGGRRNADGLARKGVRSLLAADPDGVELASVVFGRAARASRIGARAVVAGKWNRPAMLAVEVRSLLRAIIEPDGLAKRVWFRFARRRCPILRQVFEGDRRPPREVDDWLREVASRHTVIRATQP